MLETTAIEIAKSKMKEQGVDDYILRFRHIRLDGEKRRTLSADNEFYIVAERSPYFIVKSKAGVYDLQDVALREIQHVHTGTITVINTVVQSVTIMFLQIIPKLDKKQQ